MSEAIQKVIQRMEDPSLEAAIRAYIIAARSCCPECEDTALSVKAQIAFAHGWKAALSASAVLSDKEPHGKD